MGFIEALWDHLSPTVVAVFLVGALLARWVIVPRVDEYIRLRHLGGASCKSFPGQFPLGLQFIYTTLCASRDNTLLDLWRKHFAAIGAWTGDFRPMGMRVVITADAENIKAVLATQFQDFGKGEAFHSEWRDFLGDSIFTTDGEMWHTSRQLIRPQFARDRVSDLHCFESHMSTLFKCIANGGAINGEGHVVHLGPANNGKVVEMSDLFFRFTLDAATDFLLGHDVKSMCKPHERFADAFNEVQRVQGDIARAGPMKNLIPTKTFRAGLEVINRFVYQFIEHALSLSDEELATKTKSDSGYTFLHELARFTRDRKVLRDQLVAVLLAGRDTTACTLSWAIYELARHPEAVHKLRREILERLGRDGLPTFEDLKNMKYLQSVVNETLRMYPIVPFNVRVALRDTTLPRGGGHDGSLPVPVKEGTPVAYSVLVMQRRADMYPAPSKEFAPHDVFSPDRWFKWQPKPWTYIPFNGGPRICIGQQFALTEVSYVLCRIFQKYERVVSHMDPIDGGNPMLRSEIVLAPGQGVKVSFYEAADEKN